MGLGSELNKIEVKLSTLQLENWSDLIKFGQHLIPNQINLTNEPSLPATPLGSGTWDDILRNTGGICAASNVYPFPLKAFQEDWEIVMLNFIKE